MVDEEEDNFKIKIGIWLHTYINHQLFSCFTEIVLKIELLVFTMDRDVLMFPFVFSTSLIVHFFVKTFVNCDSVICMDSVDISFNMQKLHQFDMYCLNIFVLEQFNAKFIERKRSSEYC